MLKNAAVNDSNAKSYVLDAKGAKHNLANNKWTRIDGYYYYKMDGMVQTNTVAKIDGKYYGFDKNGRMYQNKTFEVYGVTYRASADGSLIVNQQYKSGKDTYYFDLFGRGYEGVHYMAGKRCVFENGKIVG